MKKKSSIEKFANAHSPNKNIAASGAGHYDIIPAQQKALNVSDNINTATSSRSRCV